MEDCSTIECLEDAEPRQEDDTEGHQEPAIGGEDGRGDRVVLPKLPHARENLDDPTIEEGSSNHQADARAYSGKNETCKGTPKDGCREREGAQAKRNRIGDAAHSRFSVCSFSSILRGSQVIQN